MSKQKGLLWFASLAIAGALAEPELRAQYAAPPTSYSVTQINGMFGTPVTMEIHRDGSKAVIDNIQGATRTRALYDLQAHTNYSWDLANPSNGCSSSSFSGDWGDPFSAPDVDELLKTATKLPGNETINGFITAAIEAVDPKSNIKIKVWREPKYGMIVKADMTPPGGTVSTVIETKQFSPVKPGAALFALPEACVKAGPPVHVPTTAERFAAETGGNGDDFVDATSGPGSPNSCSMLLRVVRAGSMQPVANFQVALDLSVDFDHPANYVFGASSAGHPATFSGGSLKEYTAQLRNGVLRVDNIPANFDLEMAFGGAGMSSATVYRHCAGPQTVLLYVVKNPDKISDGGDWMWVKSGKFATVAGR
jgi:hypothetical protein